MTTLIVFTINNHRVHQIPDSGHTGQDEIDELKEKVAVKHEVSEGKVRVSFVDEDDQAKVVSSEMIQEVKLNLNKKENRN